jgi:hypothetical protein
MGKEVLQINRRVEVFHRQLLTKKGTAVKLFRFPARPLQLERFFKPPSEQEGVILAEIKILTSKLISDIKCRCKDRFKKGGQ